MDEIRITILKKKEILQQYSANNEIHGLEKGMVILEGSYSKP